MKTKIYTTAAVLCLLAGPAFADWVKVSDDPEIYFNPDTVKLDETGATMMGKTKMGLFIIHSVCDGYVWFEPVNASPALRAASYAATRSKYAPGEKGAQIYADLCPQ